MKKAIIICALAIFVILGGIFLARGMRQQGDIALKDNFTSSFIQEDIDTGEGFHFFESKNGHYTLWYPKKFYIEEEPPYFISKDHYELMNFYESSESESGLERSFQIRYQGKKNQDSADITLKRLLDDFAFEKNYEELTTESTNIFFGPSNITMDGKEAVISNPDESHANRYFALVQNKEGTQFLSVIFRINCIDESRGSCEINDSEERSFFETFIKNISFS
ncbi:hypothetical protein [Shouchella miscanthi]|uniref:Lipoprotein n=1 Tax=Shouchella miscanthi TaxID=2598861 RepID=A0ABU6NR53_9BACI|nr:hypothetical protein [Shouchella miscanthi]